MITDTIAEYEEKRINEAQYLSKVQEIMENVLAHTDSDIPESLQQREVAKAFYGLTIASLIDKVQAPWVREEIAVQSALHIDDLIRNLVLDNENPIIDWQQKTNISGKLLIDIGDYLMDEFRGQIQYFIKHS